MPARRTGTRVLQMRLMVGAHHYDEATAFYGDVLGAREELQIHSPEGEHVTVPGRMTA